MVMKMHKRSKGFRDHDVFALAELKKNPNLESQTRFCKEHDNEQFRYYDTECKQPLCRDCFALKHNGHKCVTISEAADKARVQIKGIITNTAELQDVAEKAKQGLAEAKLKADVDHLSRLKDIKTVFENLHKVLIEREDFLINQLDQRQKKEKKVINERENHLDTFLSNVKSGIQNASDFAKSLSDVHIITDKDSVISRLTALNKQYPFERDYYHPPLITLDLDDTILIEQMQKLCISFKDAGK